MEEVRVRDGDPTGARERPARVPPPRRPVFGKWALPSVDVGEDLPPSGLDVGMGCIVDEPEPAALCVLILILPVVTGEIPGDDEVEEEVERVDAEGGPPRRLNEVDVPVVAAVVAVEESTDTEVLASLVPRQQRGFLPREMVQLPAAGGQIRDALRTHPRIGGTDPFDPGGWSHELHPRRAGDHERVPVVADHPVRRCRPYRASEHVPAYDRRPTREHVHPVGSDVRSDPAFGWCHERHGGDAGESVQSLTTGQVIVRVIP
jgi:hypothetical protein